MKKITLVIDGTPVTVDEGTTVMAAAETIGVRIPRLCWHPDLSLAGSCRLCIVEVEGMPWYMTSCSVEAWPGMVVKTNSPEIRQARRDIVELILDNHPKDCQTCIRDGDCELQDMAAAMGVRERLFEGRRKHFETDATSRSVVRESDKCILCGRCTRVCAEVQGVHNLNQQGRGFETVVTPAHMAPMDESVCIQCGQCINVCPTAVFVEQDATEAVWKALADPRLHVVVQTAPAIRATIGEGFGLPPGTPETGRLVSALRRLGFHRVFTTNFGADLTIVEESHELLNRLRNGGPLPIITSCSPGWINYLEKFYPGLIPHASSCRSPMTMLSVLAKTWYAEKAGVDPERVFMVAIMPCVAKKFEAGRPEHVAPWGAPWTDAVLTTRELIWMLKSWGIQYTALPDDAYDDPLGTSTGAGDIFGITGGVMEATLRTAHERLTGKPAGTLEFHEVRHVAGLREAEVQVADRTLRVAVANGLANARTVLDKVEADQEAFHVIEVMACPGGCSGGGGQPYPPAGWRILDPELLRLRGQALHAIDGHNRLRASHLNPAIQDLYTWFLGHPGSEKAHELLHTGYRARLPRGI